MTVNALKILLEIKMLKFVFVIVLICFAFPVQPRAGAFVSDAIRFEVADQYIEAQAGRIAYVSLGNVSVGDVYEVQARAHNAVYDDVSLFVCSKRDLDLLLAGRSSQCRGKNKTKGLVQFSVQAQQSGPQYLVLDNSYSMLVTKKLNAKVTLIARLPEQVRRKIEEGLNKASAEIQKAFVVQDFDFRIEPCGMKNAFSRTANGDITMCSELMFDLLRKKIPGAFDAVMYHELGHSLLNLWGLPGWDNEETVDEFALVMLYWSGSQEKALDWIRYYAEHDSRAQAEHILKNGDRHPLSIQRIRNVERILKNPSAVISRWNKLLYPHMTREGLQGLLKTSPKYVDRTLLDKYLASASSPSSDRKKLLAPPPPIESQSSQSLWGPVN